MLKRLIILNSDTYSKADIEFQNCNSLQIVGTNNIGKSTLIYSLNFLFIVNLKKMDFAGDRKGNKTTVHHYFPNFNRSFIIFEIFKNRYYCILINRNTEGKLDYYQIKSDYQEEFYVLQKDNRKTLRDFKSLCAEFSKNGIEYQKFKDQREVFNFIYQTGRKNNGVVWLNERGGQDARELSNSFSKIYKYLIKPSLIDEESLRESLVIAAGKENEKVSFSKGDEKKIQDILRITEEIKNIESIQRKFSQFKEFVRDYSGKTGLLSELVFAFNQQYVDSSLKLQEEIDHKKKQQLEYKHNLKTQLKPRLEKLQQKLGKLESENERNQKERDHKEKKIKEIQSFEPLVFLKQSLRGLEEDRKTIESSITQIEKRALNSKEIEKNILKTESEISNITNRIKNYSKQLIHQIAFKQETKELLNRILSDEITSLSAEHISKKINQTGELMALFDGVIQLPKTLKGKPIDSIDKLKKKKEELGIIKKENEELLPIIKEFEQSKQRLSNIKNEIKTIEEKIQKIESLPQLKQALQDLSEELKKSLEEKDATAKEIISLKQEIEKIEEEIRSISEDIIENKHQIKQFKDWKLKIEQLKIETKEYETSDSLENLYERIKRYNEERKEIKEKRDKLFDDLKRKINSSEGDEKAFIRYVEDEVATKQDKERSIKTLLEQISLQFANPCGRILSSFYHFYKFKNQFNSKLKKTKISDISLLEIEIIENEKLLKELKQIKEIDSSDLLRFEDQTKKLDILKKHINKQSVIKFQDLFNIQLKLSKEGHKRTVDLKNKVESDGTDRMVRLVLIMSIINQIMINDKENKIAIFIDEVGTLDSENLIEILKFCKENNFIPISAAPFPNSAFDKFYYVRKQEKSGKIIISDKESVVLKKIELK